MFWVLHLQLGDVERGLLLELAHGALRLGERGLAPLHLRGERVLLRSQPAAARLRSLQPALPPRQLPAQRRDALPQLRCKRLRLRGCWSVRAVVGCRKLLGLGFGRVW